MEEARGTARRSGYAATLGACTVVTALVLATACPAPKIVATSAKGGDSSLAELWRDPTGEPERDLYHGVGGDRLAPDPDGRYDFVAFDRTGSSRGFDVRDRDGVVWDVKIGHEAQPEVVVSRLLWAVGYHQLPTYYVARWHMTGGDDAGGPQPPGRFRPKLPGYDKRGEWSWHQNPFVDSPPYRGLLVLNLVVNNWDLKTSNNALYELDQEREGTRRWYVQKDIGSALGETPGRILDGKPNDLEAFEQQGFIVAVDEGHVRFDYRRPFVELLRSLTPADVRWACERLARLTDRQWQDAFRAGGYSSDQADRYIRKIRAKLAEGMSLR